MSFKKEVLLVHIDSIEPELQRFIRGIGTWFREDYLSELRKSVLGGPEEEVFVPAKAVNLATIPASKRGIKTVEQIEAEKAERAAAREKFRVAAEKQNVLSRKAYEATQNKVIWDERPVPVARAKEEAKLNHPGIMWVIAGAPALKWNSVTGDFSVTGGDNKVNWGLSRTIRDLLTEGLELEDIAAEVYWDLKAKGYEVVAVYTATEEDFEVEKPESRNNG